MSFSSIIMPSTCQQETFLRGAPLIVNGISGGAGGGFSLLQKIMYIHCFHGIYRNMPFRTPGLEINDSYLHVKYRLKNHQHIWIPLVQRGLGEISCKELPSSCDQQCIYTKNITGLNMEPWSTP